MLRRGAVLRYAVACLLVVLFALVSAAPSLAASPPVNTTAPSISGAALDEHTLTASPGAWSGDTPITYAYTWERCNTSGASCAAIAGATASAYTVTTSDAQHTLRVSVLASNDAGSASAVSAQTAVVPSSLFEFGYDNAGRLIEAADPAGSTAVYKWDGAGDLLSISHQTSSTVSVTQVTPQSAPVGAAVTIYGTGFGATASQDAVTINGTAAKVSSATATDLTVGVPSGATSGTVKVTAPGGSASSASSFTVAAGAAPTISSVSWSGSTATVAGANFNTNPDYDNLVFGLTRLDVTAATSTSLTATLPGTYGSGYVTLATPNGVATGPAACRTLITLDQCSAATLGVSQKVTINTAGHGRSCSSRGRPASR